MTSPIEQIEIECPTCFHRFKTYHRASINLNLGDMTEEDVQRSHTKQCPACKATMSLDTLVVDEDGRPTLIVAHTSRGERQHGD